MKLDITFADFSAAINGYTAREQAKGNYVVVTNNKVKTEIKCNSGIYVIGYGLNNDNLEAVIDVVTQAGYIIVERKKHQCNFEFTSLKDMNRLLSVIETAPIETKATAKAPSKATAKDTAKATKPTKATAKAKPVLTDDEVAQIKAKNLATIKKVGKKFLKGQIAEPAATGVPDFDPTEARSYVEEVSNDLDSFKAPSFLTKDEMNALI